MNTPVGGNQANQAPVVNAGPDQAVTLLGSATLNGTVTDDGPAAVTLNWTKVSGPGAVTFSDPNAATTTASFSAAGTYVLSLTASDGALSGADQLTVNVAGGGSGTGLTARYYAAIGSLKFGTLMLTRIDPTVNFNWNLGQPASQVQVDNFSVTWNGQILAPATGNYTFTTVSDDGVRLWVNGQLIINHWTGHAPTANNSTVVALTAGQRYNIRLDYYERTGRARVELRWTPPGQASEVIPTSQLFP